MVCRHSPPAPGCHFGPVPCPRSPASSFHDAPPSFDWNNAASSTPAYTVSGSESEGSRCQTRLNSHGCCVPSYHWCVVMGLPVSGEVSYTNLLLSAFAMPSELCNSSGLLPGVCQVLPPSSERWMIWPNQALVCDAYIRWGSTGDPLMW